MNTASSCNCKTLLVNSNILRTDCANDDWQSELDTLTQH